MRLTAAKPSPTTYSAISAYEAACEVVARLDAQEVSLRDEELARLARGEKIEADEVASVNATEAAAEALLRGETVKPKAKRAILDIVRERAVVRLAYDKAQAKVELARREMAAQRFAESQTELRKVGRAIVMAIFELDRALRERDVLVAKINLPAGTLPLEAWPLAGRLCNTASQAYRLAEVGVQNGWISPDELDREFDAARKAAPWR
jgi:hypothetical protein